MISSGGAKTESSQRCLFKVLKKGIHKETDVILSHKYDQPWSEEDLKSTKELQRTVDVLA